jgi:hypothetical protein
MSKCAPETVAAFIRLPVDCMPHPTLTTGRLALILWAFAIVAGFRVLVEYELKAGVSAVAPPHWPENTSLPRETSRSHLVMFAHPQCPCSRASIAELAVIMTRCAGKLKATVCFFSPEGEPAEWTQSALWRAAAVIPGVEVVADRNRQIALQFGSSTSGQVHLFDRNGRRIFSGGITAARGHEGENNGRNFIVALARGEVCSPTDTPVYGCSLVEPAAREVGL